MRNSLISANILLESGDFSKNVSEFSNDKRDVRKYSLLLVFISDACLDMNNNTTCVKTNESIPTYIVVLCGSFHRPMANILISLLCALSEVAQPATSIQRQSTPSSFFS